MKVHTAFVNVFIVLLLPIFTAVPGLHAASYTITVNGSVKQGAVPHFWSECVGTGTMWYCQKPEWRTAAKIGATEAGFKAVRGHGLLMGLDGVDRIGIFKWDGVGAPTYHWATFDSIFDFLVNDCKMRPIVELSFQPKDLQSGDFKSKPKNLTVYRDMIKAIVSHCVTRYGLAAVRTWYWEVWNEPDHGGFFSNSMSDYYQMYQKASEAVKSVDSLILVGGPASTNAAGGQIEAFINFCKTNNVKYDFVSNHIYGGGGAGPNCWTTGIRDDNRFRTTAIKNSGTLSTLSINTEYNSSYSGQGGKVGANTISMDSHVNAPFIVKCVKLVLDDQLNNVCKLPAVLSYWTISDVFDESGTDESCFIENNNYVPFGQVFGLINYQGIRKAAFNAFKLLHKMGTTRLSLAGGTGAGDGVDGFATINADSTVATVILFNYYVAMGGQTAIDTINLAFNNIPVAKGSMEIRHYRIDTTHSNAYGAWLKQGKPVSPTAAQWDEMKAASALAEMYPAKTVTNAGSAYTEKIALPRQSVSMLQFSTLNVSIAKTGQKTISRPALTFFHGVISLSNDYAVQPLNVSIYGLDGTLIKRCSSRTGSLDVQTITANRGVYLIRASAGKEKLAAKIIRTE